jgi:hypothetical protein
VEIYVQKHQQRYHFSDGKAGAVFIRVQKRQSKDGRPHHYASVVRNDRIKGKVVQTTVAYLGLIDEEQIPYLKAAYAKHKPKLLYDDGTLYP